MSQIDINELFDESRFPGGWKLFTVLVYLPIGLILVLLRFIVFLLSWLLAAALPESEALRYFLSHCHAFVFGIIVKVSPSGENKDEETRVVIANSISILDYFVLSIAANTMSPSHLNLPDSLCNTLGVKKMNMSSKDALIAEIKRFISNTKSSVALQPELDTTNSRKALLKFNTWPFSIEPSVQPVVLQAYRPEFVDIRLTSIPSIWWMDVLCFMFVPYTIFTAKFLRVKRNAEAQFLVREVEKDIAQVLKIETSVHTVSDKAEYIKRHVMEEAHNRNTQNSMMPGSQIIPSIEMQRMVRQVSEIFPLVPHNVILKDLLKTKNTDVTIANILDGVVISTPDAVQTTATPSSSTSKHSVSTLKMNNSSSAALTFQERKAKMIAEAREKYKQKHFLKDC